MATPAPTPQPRMVSPETRPHLTACLVWLGEGQFIEDYGSSVYADAATAYNDTLPKPGMSIRAWRELAAFLSWMDYGDRLHRVGPDNPYGVNVEFSAHDYHYGLPGQPSREEVCAGEMVSLYESGL